MNRAQSLLKFIKNRGGYPNPRINNILEILEIEPKEFLMSLHQKLGDEKLMSLIQNSLKKLQTNNNFFRIYPYSKFGDKESYIDLNFDDSEILLSDINDNRWATILIENWSLGDSYLLVEPWNDDVEGTVEYTLDGLIDAISEDDPYQSQEAVDEWMGILRDSVSSYLGLPIYLGDRKK